MLPFTAKRPRLANCCCFTPDGQLLHLASFYTTVGCSTLLAASSPTICSLLAASPPSVKCACIHLLPRAPRLQSTTEKLFRREKAIRVRGGLHEPARVSLSAACRGERHGRDMRRGARRRGEEEKRSAAYQPCYGPHAPAPFEWIYKVEPHGASRAAVVDPRASRQ